MYSQELAKILVKVHFLLSSCHIINMQELAKILGRRKVGLKETNA